MAERGMMRMDDAKCVAESIMRAIEKDKNEVCLGFPELLFARLNGVFPGLVDQGIAKQVPDILEYPDQNR